VGLEPYRLAPTG